jgi:hypothetical protein
MSVPEPQAETVVLVPVPARAALESKLRDLKEQFDALEAVEPGHHRLAAHQSLIAVIEFIDSFPEWKGLGLDFALDRLMRGLMDVENGRTVDWLMPDREGGRPPLLVTAAAIRGRCAGIMQLLIDAGRSREAAARFVMKHLPADLLDKLTHRRRTWRTVAKWRDDMAGETEGEAYRAMLQMANTPACRAAGAEAVAAAALRALHRQPL